MASAWWSAARADDGEKVLCVKTILVTGGAGFVGSEVNAPQPNVWRRRGRRGASADPTQDERCGCRAAPTRDLAAGSPAARRRSISCRLRWPMITPQPASRRLRNPDQLRRGERYHPSRFRVKIDAD
jgi:hypothetical protein